MKERKVQQSGGEGGVAAVRKCDRPRPAPSVFSPTAAPLLSSPLLSTRWSMVSTAPWSPGCLASAPFYKGWEERRGLRPGSYQDSCPPPARAMDRSDERDAAQPALGCR